MAFESLPPKPYIFCGSSCHAHVVRGGKKLTREGAISAAGEKAETGPSGQTTIAHVLWHSCFAQKKCPLLSPAGAVCG